MKLRSIRLPRRLVQIGCALAFVAIPFLNRAEINTVSGNFLAFNAAGVPLGDPLAALQVLVMSLSPVGPMLIGALLTLLLALFLGPVFCSWLCPYGLLSELVHGFPASERQEQSDERPGEHPLDRKKKGKGPSAKPFISRLAVVAAGLLLVAFMVPFPLLNQLSMPGWYSRTLQHIALAHNILWGGIIFLLGMLLIEKLLGKRLWCRYFCPQSVLISLAGLIFSRRLQVAFKKKSCTCPASDRLCAKKCSLGLDPRAPLELSQRAQCTNCGDCVDACQSRGRALGMRFSQPSE